MRRGAQGCAAQSGRASPAGSGAAGGWQCRRGRFIDPAGSGRKSARCRHAGKPGRGAVRIEELHHGGKPVPGCSHAGRATWTAVHAVGHGAGVAGEACRRGGSPAGSCRALPRHSGCPSQPRQHPRRARPGGGGAGLFREGPGAAAAPSGGALQHRQRAPERGQAGGGGGFIQPRPGACAERRRYP